MSVPSELPAAVADTDVVSLVFRGDTRGDLYRPHLDGHQVTLSFMTVAELRRWALERGWGERRRIELEEYLRRFSVYHSNGDLCDWWAAAMVGARQAGRRIEVADAWIAATALLYGVPLITHNPGDYAGVEGLQIITEASV
jgi:tRNA(fMet)-specific endonuclease VapC